MDKNALKVKANIEALKKLGLDIASLGDAWLALLMKCALYETSAESVYTFHDTAVAIANDVKLAPGADFQKFTDGQAAALTMKRALVAPVDALLKKRAKLTDVIGKTSDKKKLEALKAELVKGNVAAKALGALIVDDDPKLAPVILKPRATATSNAKTEYANIPPEVKQQAPMKRGHDVIPPILRNASPSQEKKAEPVKNEYANIPPGVKQSAPLKRGHDVIPANVRNAPPAQEKKSEPVKNEYANIPPGVKQQPPLKRGHDVIPENVRNAAPVENKKPEAVKNEYANIPPLKQGHGVIPAPPRQQPKPEPVKNEYANIPPAVKQQAPLKRGHDVIPENLRRTPPANTNAPKQNVYDRVPPESLNRAAPAKKEPAKK